MPTKYAIANAALRELGANTAVKGETSKEASLIEDLWDILLKEALEQHTWDFAKGVKSLGEDANCSMPDAKWEYAYTLPTDFVRMGRKKANDFKYERRGQHLLTNESPCIIEYVYLEEDPTKFPAHFVMALRHLLMGSFAIPLAKKGTKAIDFKRLFYEVAMPEARKLDAHQSNMSAEDTSGVDPDSDSWVEDFD